MSSTDTNERAAFEAYWEKAISKQFLGWKPMAIALHAFQAGRASSTASGADLLRELIEATLADQPKGD